MKRIEYEDLCGKTIRKILHFPDRDCEDTIAIVTDDGYWSNGYLSLEDRLFVGEITQEELDALRYEERKSRILSDRKRGWRMRKITKRTTRYAEQQMLRHLHPDTFRWMGRIDRVKGRE